MEISSLSSNFSNNLANIFLHWSYALLHHTVKCMLHKMLHEKSLQVKYETEEQAAKTEHTPASGRRNNSTQLFEINQQNFSLRVNSSSYLVLGAKTEKYDFAPCY